MAPAQTGQRSLIAPHHRVYLFIVVAPVFFFTVLSLFLQTHAYNVSLSAAPSRVLDGVQSKLSPVTSIFAHKDNWINRLFLKYSWFWTTMACMAQALTLRTPASGLAEGKGKAKAEEENGTLRVADSRIRSFIRWLIATGCWIAFAGWLFGPSIMQRIFTSSGGVCIPRPEGPNSLSGMSNPSGSASMTEPGFQLPEGTFLDEAFCRAGGRGISKADRPDLFRTAHLMVTEGIPGSRLRGQCESKLAQRSGVGVAICVD